MRNANAAEGSGRSKLAEAADTGGGVQPTRFLAPGHAPYCRASFVLFSLWVAAGGLLGMYFTYYVIDLEGYPWRPDYFISCLLLVFFEGVAIFIFVDTVRHGAVKRMVILCKSFQHRGCVISVISNPACGCWFPLCVCGQLWVLVSSVCVWSVAGVGFLCVWSVLWVLCVVSVVGVVFLCVSSVLWVLFFVCVWSVSWMLFFSVALVSCGCYFLCVAVILVL